MEIFRTDVRHLVLKIKSSEEKQKKCKEKLANIFRTMHYCTIANTSIKNDFSSDTKQILVQLKETDEQNKSLRTILREILVKIREQKFVNTEKIPVVNNKRQSTRDLSLIPNIQRSHHPEGRILPISSKSELNINTREIRGHGAGNLVSTASTTSDVKLKVQEKSVNFENKLTKTFREFKCGNLISRLGIERENLEKNLFFKESSRYEGISTRLTFLRILPEFKKIKCKNR